MKNIKLSYKEAEKISRTFSIMFNRTSMYKMDHPFTIQSIEGFYKTISEALNNFSPIVLTFNRDQFFIDEELFDERFINSRIIAHFKKAGIQSISFEKGIQKDELDEFVKIFTNQKSHPTAACMISALTQKIVTNLKINHFIYKKITENDEIVSKDKLKQISTDSHDNSLGKMHSDVMNMLAKNILMEEVEKSISLEAILSDPEKLSKDIIDSDLSQARNSQTESGSPGIHIADLLAKFREEAEKTAENTDNLSLSELADAVFDLKKKLIEGVESQKALGIIYENETQIIDEANALTDQVLIQLVKDEYKKGKISIQRLAQILRRLVPEPNELRRLLPKLSETMLEEGMPKAEFTELIKELGKELQNENLLSFLQKGAEKIGVGSENLIKEFKNDPSCAAELIYLASEIRKGTGDKNVLTDILVEYIERLGSNIVLEETNPDEQAGSNHLREVIANVESEIVSKLEKKDIDKDVLKAVHQKLAERMDSFFDKVKTDWEKRQETALSNEEMSDTTIFRLLEESVEDGEEFHKILKQIRSSINEKGIDENNIEQLLSEIKTLRKLRKKEEDQIKNDLPDGILSYKNTLLFIEKEVSRSLRYGTPFSAITFSAEKITPKQPIPQGAINGHQLNKYIMGELISILRSADFIGILTKKILVVLLTMTENQNAKKAMSRILKNLNAKTFTINGISLSVKFVGAVTSFEADLTPDFASFIRALENQHQDFLIRLRNVQDLYLD